MIAHNKQYEPYFTEARSINATADVVISKERNLLLFVQMPSLCTGVCTFITSHR